MNPETFRMLAIVVVGCMAALLTLKLVAAVILAVACIRGGKRVKKMSDDPKPKMTHPSRPPVDGWWL